MGYVSQAPSTQLVAHNSPPAPHAPSLRPGAHVALEQHPPLQTVETPSHDVEHAWEAVLHACPGGQSVLVVHPPDELEALEDELLLVALVDELLLLAALVELPPPPSTTERSARLRPSTTSHPPAATTVATAITSTANGMDSLISPYPLEGDTRESRASDGKHMGLYSVWLLWRTLRRCEEHDDPADEKRRPSDQSARSHVSSIERLIAQAHPHLVALGLVRR
jgi:hypothetical protein